MSERKRGRELKSLADLELSAAQQAAAKSLEGKKAAKSKSKLKSVSNNETAAVGSVPEVVDAPAVNKDSVQERLNQLTEKIRARSPEETEKLMAETVRRREEAHNKREERKQSARPNKPEPVTATVSSDYPEAPTTPKAQPEPEPEVESELTDNFSSEDLDPESEAQLRQAFNATGFIDFLAENPDENFDMRDTSKVLQMFEAFQVKEKIAVTMKDVAAKHFKNAFGVEGMESLSAIDDQLTVEAYAHPEIMAYISEQVDQFNLLPKEIADLEKKLKAVQRELPEDQIIGREDFQKKKETMEIAQRSIGFKGWIKETFMSGKDFDKNLKARREMKKELKGEGLKFNRENIATKLQILQKDFDQSTALKKLQEAAVERTNLLAGLRSQMIQDALNQGAIKEELQKKVQKNIENMTNGEADFSDMEQAQELLERILAEKDYPEEGEEAKPYFADLAEPTQIKLDKALEAGLSRELAKILNSPLNQKDTFAKLEKSISGYIEKKKMGSRQGDAVRELVVKALLKLEKKKDTTKPTKIKIRAYLLLNNSKRRKKEEGPSDQTEFGLDLSPHF